MRQIPIPMWIPQQKISLLLAIIPLILQGCQNNQTKKSAHDNSNFDFDWLCGEWINNHDTSAIFYENWHKIDAQNYKGISFILAKNDTVFFESIDLIKKDTGAYYTVSVRNQNENEKVHFKMVSSAKQHYVFENKNHDFPQTINYQYQSPDTLNAWIAGTVKGKLRKESFLMWRVH